jgi:glyoxalase family protein
MNFPSTGFHHITVCSGKAQDDIDFFTGVLGQRLIKQTILFDGRFAHYHLYYANGHIDPGTVMTSFPYSRLQGRPGSGQVQSTAYSVQPGALPFWLQHLDRHRVEHSDIQERFGQRFVAFRHPAGLGFEVIEDPREKRAGTAIDGIEAADSARGFNSITLSVREIAEDERFLVEALGFARSAWMANTIASRWAKEVRAASWICITMPIGPRAAVVSAPGRYITWPTTFRTTRS